jgi:phosphoribosylformylglycinamidine synthase
MIIPGPSAISDFRRARLGQTLRQAGIDVTLLEARFWHFVALEDTLSESAQNTLTRLLDYGPAPREWPQDISFLVTPRAGTISPWSSKATDIARSSGLDAVKRIERGTAWLLEGTALPRPDELNQLVPLFDPMTETLVSPTQAHTMLFATSAPRRLRRIGTAGEALGPALTQANDELGLGLEPAELEYLTEHYQALGQLPSDVELMMFAQVNSEHCRHKIFNAGWTIDGNAQNQSLFDMIRHTHAAHPGKVLSAYADNSAVSGGWPASTLHVDVNGVYGLTTGQHDLLMKVETHNHPTAISPFPGAATGSGGEIRDEAATGRGARAKAGLTGFCVSNLRLPGAERSWEQNFGKPKRIASALDIMLEAPIGAASFNNEFGRPALLGFFRTLEHHLGDTQYGYHKPIMLAGGVGNILPENIEKQQVRSGDAIVVLGGPAMLIGLGGGAASSQSSGSGDAGADFASVQRGNAEMQRRAQMVIDACWQAGTDNPVRSLHDVGAGGLSNAVPEIVHADGCGADLDIRTVPSADHSMSPLEIWCNESQERYVLAISPQHLGEFAALCERERCPHAVLGYAADHGHLRVTDSLLGDMPVDLPMDMLLGKLPRMQRSASRITKPDDDTSAAATLVQSLTNLDLNATILKVLDAPAVADKSFLITIGDRTVGGLSHRDQMVGPWQVPVADHAVTLTDHQHFTGEVMSMGERTPIAMLNAPASGRMAIAEAVTNAASAYIEDISNIVLSANWMAACGHPGQDTALFDTVKTVGMDICPALGICIPVGKDSLSMKTVWQSDVGNPASEVVSPVSLIVSAFAPVADVRKCVTPELHTDGAATRLLYIDLGFGQYRLGGSILSQVEPHIDSKETPDLDSAPALREVFAHMQQWLHDERVLACHDRSDGGLIATLAEMAFASNCGLKLDFSPLLAHGITAAAALFAEEPGLVIQVRAPDAMHMLAALVARAPILDGHVHDLGTTVPGDAIDITLEGLAVVALSRQALRTAWSSLTAQMATRRDDPDAAREEHAARLAQVPLLTARNPHCEQKAPAILNREVRVAVLREQGVNGHNEMAAAFLAAGLTPVDVHMSDLGSGRFNLADFNVLAACGGFSYGDVLGGGGGWAGAVRHDPRVADEFAQFFHASSTLTLGVCNGCQMLAQLSDLIPGANAWPRFVRNRSEQFEARLSAVEVTPSPSVLLADLVGAVLPVPVAHGEGLVHWPDATQDADALVAMRFVDGNGAIASTYPQNPNGSIAGMTGFTSTDGRATIMMPHPERATRVVQMSWAPSTWSGASPWSQIFESAARALA